MAMVRDALLFGISLLTLFNPPSVMAAFASLARGYPADIQTRMARRTALYYAVAVLLLTWAGRPLLSILGLSLPALRMAGGFVLLLAAVPMVTQYQRGDTDREAELEAELEAGARTRNWAQLVAVPLTFPISIGGATAAAVIAAGGGRPNLLRALLSSAVCLVMTAVVWLTLRSAVPLTRRISRGSMAALTALSGLLLLCIAFQLIAAGLRDLLPGLSHP
ncbi:MAG TPA: MarC family protein [Polyangia bacterium]|jgi:multiple antibiotic resistance protein